MGLLDTAVSFDKGLTLLESLDMVGMVLWPLFLLNEKAVAVPQRKIAQPLLKVQCQQEMNMFGGLIYVRMFPFSLLFLNVNTCLSTLLTIFKLSSVSP